MFRDKEPFCQSVTESHSCPETRETPSHAKENQVPAVAPLPSENDGKAVITTLIGLMDAPSPQFSPELLAALKGRGFHEEHLWLLRSEVFEAEGRAYFSLFNELGEVVGVKSRATSLLHSTCRAETSVKGLLLANQTGRLALFNRWSDHDTTNAVIVVVEGEIDLLVWSVLSQSKFAVFGVFNGAGWEAINRAVPLGANVYIRTHCDATGDNYATKIAAAIGHRANWFRLATEGDVGDEQERFHQGLLNGDPAQDCVKFDPPPRPEKAASSLPLTSSEVVTQHRAEAFLRGVLRDRSANVRNAGVDRNNTLNAEAFAIGQYLHHAGHLETECREALLQAAIGAGLSRKEAEKTVDSAFKSGKVKPRDIPERALNQPQPTVASLHQDNGSAEDEKLTENGSSEVEKLTENSISEVEKVADCGNAEEKNLADSGSAEDKNLAAAQVERPEIIITAFMKAVNDRALEVLAQHDKTVWQRLGQLVTVTRFGSSGYWTDCEGHYAIAPITIAALRERMSSIARWMKFTSKGEAVPKPPPSDYMAAIIDRRSWSEIPYLAGLCAYPIQRRDGSIAAANGYDHDTKLFLTDVPDSLCIHATHEGAIAAVDLFRDLLCNFPFADQISFAAWIAALLTPLARPAFTGCTPLFLVSANIRAAGKSLLVDLVSLILTGRKMPCYGYPVNQEAEVEKILVATALAGLPLLSFDNVAGSLGGGNLDRWLTSERPSGRILGQSEVKSFDWSTVLYATANNATIAGDTDRRSIYIKLLSELESPEHRTDLKYPDITAYAQRHRSELLSAALSILAGYHAAGRPKMKGRNKGSYAAWCAAVRDAVMWAGLDDCERAPDDENRPVDSEAALLGSLLPALETAMNGRAMTVAEILMRSEELDDAAITLKGVLSEMASRPDVKTIGYRLRAWRDRWMNDRCLKTPAKKTRGGTIWQVIHR